MIFLEKPGAITLKLLSTSSVIIKIDSKDNVEWDCHKRNSFRRTKLITSGVKHLVVTTCAQVYLLPWCDKHSGWDRNKNPCKIVWKPIHLCCSCFSVTIVTIVENSWNTWIWHFLKLAKLLREVNKLKIVESRYCVPWKILKVQSKPVHWCLTRSLVLSHYDSTSHFLSCDYGQHLRLSSIHV